MSKKKREVRIIGVQRFSYPPDERQISFEWFRDGHLQRATIAVKDGLDAWDVIALHLTTDDAKLLDQVREV